MDAALGVVRIFIGALILMTGIMKFTVPMLRAAWSGQLRLARLPFYNLTFWLLPVVELTVGTLLILGCGRGRLPRRGVVDGARRHLRAHRGGRPSVFPLQPNAPIVPVVVIVLTIYVLVGGTGDWHLG